MYSKVKLSTYSSFLTIFVLGVLFFGCFYTFGKWVPFYVVLGVLILLILAGLFYGPVSVSADDKQVTVHSILRKHIIPIRNIKTVESFQPTMGAYRLCASGGYMGYWGLFREGDVGRYVAYYGKASDCFIIKMKNGDKYVLGCENPNDMLEFVKSKINS